MSAKQSDIERRMELLRTALPACQPQEGSPANTFTLSELEELRIVMNKDSKLGPRDNNTNDALSAIAHQMDIFNPKEWIAPQPNTLCIESQQDAAQPQEDQEDLVQSESDNKPKLDEVVRNSWHGAPKLTGGLVSQQFRHQVRQGKFTNPTNGQCPGFMQCNLVVLPQGQHAFDFLLFCQRNKKACPLIEVCDVGSPHPVGVARGADLRTDVPKYAIYRNGVLEKEVDDATDHWPENSVAFLIGCSFSYDGAFIDAGIPLRSAEEGKNVPMYRTNLPCRSSGSLHGNMVVSMKPIKAVDIAKEVEITSQYPHAHGGPVCVGNPKAIGILDMDQPDWGEQIDIREDEVAVFHACGVTPQSVLMDSKVPFAITHSAGYMFVTDLPSDSSI